MGRPSRRYLGIELSKQYVTETKARLARTKPGHPLDGAEDPLTSVATAADGTIRAPDGRRVKRNGKPPRTTRLKKKVAQVGLWD